MSNLDQCTAAFDACGLTYESAPGGAGTTVTVHDANEGSGYALWHFHLDGSLDFVTHHSE